jgi:hypothetical protein
MAKYIFCAWAVPDSSIFSTKILDTVPKVTADWNLDREDKFTAVYWTGTQKSPSKMTRKISLKADDQVYILGHHEAGTGYITDVSAEEIDKLGGGFKPCALPPGELAKRFSECFTADPGFTGKIKFYNCESGVKSGASFAKPAAGLLRANFPNALYIGYSKKVSQVYGEFQNVEEGTTEFRKLGLTKERKSTGERAKQLQVDVGGENEMDSLKALLGGGVELQPRLPRRAGVPQGRKGGRIVPLSRMKSFHL